MSIEKTYELPFPLEVVYAAWISSDTVISPATAMDILPETGGHYRLIMETPEFSGRNEGAFLSLKENEHLRYTWEWNGDGEVTEIDVTFASVPAGTKVIILHTGFEKQESIVNHASGWDSYMAGLVDYLGR